MATLLDKSEQMFKLLRTEEDFEKFLKLNSTSIRLTQKTMKRSVCSQGQKLRRESELLRLKALQLKAKNRHRKTGSGMAVAATNEHKKRSNRVEWVELKSAFNSRIRTGAVCNITHKFPEEFLDDALRMLKIRIQNVLKNVIAIKVNVELVAKYALERTGEIDDKFFGTPNVLITRTTDLKADVLDQFKEIILRKVSFII